MGTVRIPLTQGKFALIDEEDYPLVSKHKWYAKRDGHTFYALTNVRDRTVRLHRLILEAPTGVLVDHANGDGLDNRRCNLRFATRAQNGWNRRKCSSLTGFRGVAYVPRRNRYQVYLRHNGILEYVGIFKTADEAAHAYDAKARECYGEFARLNFPDKGVTQ